MFQVHIPGVYRGNGEGANVFTGCDYDQPRMRKLSLKSLGDRSVDTDTFAGYIAMLGLYILSREDVLRLYILFREDVQSEHCYVP